jgi:hypothetical protein
MAEGQNTPRFIEKAAAASPLYETRLTIFSKRLFAFWCVTAHATHGSRCPLGRSASPRGPVRRLDGIHTNSLEILTEARNRGVSPNELAELLDNKASMFGKS